MVIQLQCHLLSDYETIEVFVLFAWSRIQKTKSAIRFLCANGSSAAELHGELCQVYGPTVTSERLDACVVIFELG